MRNQLINCRNFSIKHDLALPDFKDEGEDNFRNKQNNLNNYLVLMNPNNNINIRMNQIKSKLKVLNSEFVNSSDILLMAESIKESVSPQNLLIIKKLDSDLQSNSSIFTKSDPLLISLKKSRKDLIEAIKERIIDNLEAELLMLKIEKESNSRPKEIISKFRQLYGLATRNSVSLENLEKELHVVSIQNAKSKVPWKLITDPTVLDKPVGPLRELIIAQQFIYGLLLGLLSSLIRNLSRNTVFSEIKIKRIFNTKILETLSPKQLKSWEEAFRLIKNDPLNDSKKSLAIIYTDDIKDKYLDKISELIYIDKNPNLVCLTKDIIEAKKYSNKILFLQKGSISADDLLKLS